VALPLLQRPFCLLFQVQGVGYARLVPSWAHSSCFNGACLVTRKYSIIDAAVVATQYGAQGIVPMDVSREEHYVQLLLDAMKEGQCVENGWKPQVYSEAPRHCPLPIPTASTTTTLQFVITSQTAQHSTAHTAQHSTAQYSTAKYSAVWYKAQAKEFGGVVVWPSNGRYAV